MKRQTGKTAEAIVLHGRETPTPPQWRGRDGCGEGGRRQGPGQALQSKISSLAKEVQNQERHLSAKPFGPTPSHRSHQTTQHSSRVLPLACWEGWSSSQAKGWPGEHKAEASHPYCGGPFFRKGPHLQIRLPQSFG